MTEEIEVTRWLLNDEKTENPEVGNIELVQKLDFVKTRALVNYISDNFLSADLKWSLFCAACNSYRFDSVLKPFPPFFLHQDNIKQIERLREVVELCPSLADVLTQLKDDTLPSVLKDLLHWVLIQLNDPHFKYIIKEEHQDIISQASSELPATMPDYIFSVISSTRSQQKFNATSLSCATKLAFHGSRLDNFYSIANYGLQVSFNKTAAFGPGIYLSNEMIVSLPYSTSGFTWGSSYFGSHISVLALCEVINHPDVRSEQDNGLKILNMCDRTTSGKYLIVKNSDLVCVRYLLIYTSDDFESASLMQSPTLLGWFKRHKMFVFVLAYVILLLGIGSSNSSLLYRYYRKVSKWFDSDSQQ